MDCYLKSIDYDLWYIVMHGDMTLMKKMVIDLLRKLIEDFDEKDKIMTSKNAKAKN